MIKAACAALLALAVVAAPAAAKDAGIIAREAWSRPAAAGGNAAGFVTLVNPGRTSDAVVGAESPLASRVELHASSMAGGVMRMAAEPQVAVPARGQAVFAPSGRHLMFVGLKRPLKSGDRLPATLRFASGQRLAVEFAVSATPPAVAAPGAHEMHGMH